jgi:hypothetical protein
MKKTKGKGNGARRKKNSNIANSIESMSQIKTKSFDFCLSGNNKNKLLV